MSLSAMGGHDKICYPEQDCDYIIVDLGLQG